MSSTSVFRFGVVLAAVLSAAGSAWAVTPLTKIRYTPDVTTVLSGTTVGPANVAEDDLAGTVTLVGIGSIPDGTRLDGYAVASNGDQFLSFDTAVVLGGTTFQRNDVIRYSGGAYSLALSGSAAGIPDGVDVKDVALHGTNLLLSFDSGFSAGSVTFTPRDVAEWNGAALSKFFDGVAAGIPDGVRIDGLHLLPNGHLLLSFDVAGVVGGVSFNHEDILEYTPGSGTWEMAYAGAGAQPSGWGAADLTAFDATAGSVVFDVAVSLSGPASVGVNSAFSYTVVVTNLGPQGATGLSLSEPLPAGVLFQSLTPAPGWVCTTPAVGAGGTVTCTTPTLAPGAPVVFSISVTAPGTAQTLNATATVSTGPIDTNPANNVATLSTSVAASAPTGFDVSLVKIGPASAAPGGPIEYTLVVVNNGPASATSLTVTDPLPAGVLFQSLTAPPGWVCTTPVVGAGGTVSCTLATLAVATPQVFSIAATAPTVSEVVTNTATVATSPVDSNAANDTASAQTVVGQAPPSAIPTLHPVGLLALTGLLAAFGASLSRRTV
ncbi:MAG: DUF11 domain-containing protein [Thermoanaerobaculia bacterium]